MTTDGDKQPEISPEMYLWAADQHERTTGHNVMRPLAADSWVCGGTLDEDCDVNGSKLLHPQDHRVTKGRSR